MSTIRPAAVAGMFYPGEADVLRAEVDAFLHEAAAPKAGMPPKVLVVPHAGYRYSGAIAASGYAQLGPWAAVIRRVVLLGPAHRVAMRGLAAPRVDAFASPLGAVPLDREALALLDDLPQVLQDDRAHALEHSLEVQLPFLQAMLSSAFTLAPLVVGSAGPEEVAEVLERLWGGDETLIVISTDLSHYLPDTAARATDRHTASRIVALATDLDPYEACGAHALNGALLAARRRGLRAELLDLRNSGDTSGDRRRVVGYASLALRAPVEAVDDDTDVSIDEPSLGEALLAHAHNAIARALGQPLEPEAEHPALHEPGATFVTLKDAGGRLRGCIGRLAAERALAADVHHNALAAAFQDPRFHPLALGEWHGLRIEVSVLDPATALPAAATLEHAATLIERDVDGVILEWRGRRATFLPQVWEQLPEPSDFLQALLRKAGLSPSFWAEDVRLQRYRVRKFERAPVAATRGVLS